MNEVEQIKYEITSDVVRSFVCFDFETTGFSGENDKVTEIGAVKVIDGEITDVYSQLVNPEKKIPYPVVAVTGITDEMVKDKPTIEEILPSFLEFTEGLPLVAHNAQFDCKFLMRDALKIGEFPKNKIIDTLKIAKEKLKNVTKDKKLTTLTNYFGISHNNAHRAWCDAEATAKLYIKLCDY